MTYLSLRRTTTTKATTKRPKKDHPPRSDTGNGGTEQCMGTCVTGFFALLCDAIDRNAHCPGNGRCCLTKKVEKPKPAKKTTPKPLPKTNDKCPGVCIPHIMESFCTKPSTLIKQSTCQQGTVCCNSNKDDKGNSKIEVRQPTTTKQPKRKPPLRKPSRPSGGGSGDLTSLLIGMAPQLLTAATGNSGAGSAAAALLPVLAPALGGLLGGGGGGGTENPDRNPTLNSGGGGGAGLASLALPLLGAVLGGGGGGSGGQQQAPPRQDIIRKPYRRPTPAPTTTTTTEKPDDRTDCPGTCIGSYLSFTCFGKTAMKYFDKICKP